MLRHGGMHVSTQGLSTPSKDQRARNCRSGGSQQIRGRSEPFLNQVEENMRSSKGEKDERMLVVVVDVGSRYIKKNSLLNTHPTAYLFTREIKSSKEAATC